MDRRGFGGLILPQLPPNSPRPPATLPVPPPEGRFFARGTAATASGAGKWGLTPGAGSGKLRVTL